MLKRLLICALLLWGAYSWWSTRPITHPPGIIAGHVPEQNALSDAQPFDYNGYRITPLAEFTVEARVLARENYRTGREAELSPLDVMLGWGRMSDETVVKNFSFNQSGRFGYWQAPQLPIPVREIETSAANMHLIPADRGVARQLDRLRVGQLVQLRGYLIRADAPDGWRWLSSLTRTDTGAGACELFWVREMRE